MSTYADAIRRQAEDAPRAALPAVAKALWTAFAAGQITEAEALSVLIEARQLTPVSVALQKTEQPPNPTRTAAPAKTPQDRQRSPRTGVGSRPRQMPALSADAIGRPLGGFLRPSQHGSP